MLESLSSSSRPDPPTTPQRRILCVDDESEARSLARRALEPQGIEVVEAGSCAEALSRAAEGGIDAAVLDLMLPDGDGISLLPRLRALLDQAPVIIVTSHGSTAKAVQAIREGAFDFLEKPFGIESLRVAVANALAFGVLARREEFHRAKAFEDRYGADDPFETVPPVMREVLRKAAPTRATILLTGETGAGKEHAAATIHAASPRAKAAFVALNCAAIPAALAESELFGHERGAFTGAVSARPGKFEIADGGTLFLDEIGELPLELQPKLLRALDTGEVTRIGARACRKIDARILAATNRDLEAEVKAGRFRADLFFRLNVLRIEVPALRETRDRIPALALLFLNRAAKELGRRFRGFAPDALAVLATYPFPGNVRELANAVERAAILEDGAQITAASLGLSAKSGPGPQAVRGAFREARDSFEREYFRALLEQTGGNQSEAARIAGMHRNNLRAHLSRLGLEDEKP